MLVKANYDFCGLQTSWLTVWNSSWCAYHNTLSRIKSEDCEFMKSVLMESCSNIACLIRRPVKICNVHWLRKCMNLGHRPIAGKPAHFRSSSRSRTDFSNLIRIVVLEGCWAVGVPCAVTRAGCEELRVIIRWDKAMTHKSESIKNSFDNSSCERWTA